MNRERRWVIRVVLGAVAATAFWMTQAGIAFADNCSGVNDCLQSDSAAVWVGMAAFMLLVLDIGWHLLPLTGLLDAVLGYNVITGEALSFRERVIGVVTFPLDVFPGGGTAVRMITHAITAESVVSSVDESDMYRQVAFDRMVMFHLITPDDPLVIQGDDAIRPGGPGGDVQISGKPTYGGDGTLQIQTGPSSNDTITISTNGPIQQGDSIRIEFQTTGGGTGSTTTTTGTGTSGV